MTFHLVVWVLKAEVAVLTEKETVVFRGSGGLSCHGRAEWRVGTLREVGRLLRRIPTAASDRLNDQRSRGRGEKRLQPHPPSELQQIAIGKDGGQELKDNGWQRLGCLIQRRGASGGESCWFVEAGGVRGRGVEEE